MIAVGQNLKLLKALCNTFPVDDVSAEMPQGYRHANFPSDNFSNNHFFLSWFLQCRKTKLLPALRSPLDHVLNASLSSIFQE